MKKTTINISRDVIEEIGVNVEEITGLLQLEQHKNYIHCLLFHKIMNSTEITCLWPSQCGHKQ